MKYIKLLLVVSCMISCIKSKKLQDVPKYDFPSPVDTRTRPIELQAVKTYMFDSVYVSNDFPSARLNDFKQLNDSTFQVTISPENSPINESPWYAFKIWSNSDRKIDLKLHYTEHAHRYNPKLSYDGEQWKILDTTFIQLDKDSIDATIKLNINSDTLWVSSQEIHDTKRVGDWIRSFKENKNVVIDTIGKSVYGRPLYFMNITEGTNLNKPTIIIISRQHPPEVTGYLAMKSFIETIIKKGAKNDFLKKYRVMVYPLLNPDGVDLGHYRHNTGGVDLNRDWSQYNQSEIAQITKNMVKETTNNKNNVVLGLDFHSTYHDVYYTPDESVQRKIPDFTKNWLEKIRVKLSLDSINESPGKINLPTSSGWFNKQFGATGITYEIGDKTPRDFIRLKGKVSAEAMMEYFLKSKS